MIRRLKHGVTLVAIYAMALHVLLAAFVPGVAGSGPTADPFKVICHSGPNSGGDTDPHNPAPIPGQACEHCNFCSAVAPPPPSNLAIDVEFTPTIVRPVIDIGDLPPRIGFAADSKLARGPPPFA